VLWFYHSRCRNIVQSLLPHSGPCSGRLCQRHRISACRQVCPTVGVGQQAHLSEGLGRKPSDPGDYGFHHERRRSSTHARVMQGLWTKVGHCQHPTLVPGSHLRLRQVPQGRRGSQKRGHQEEEDSECHSRGRTQPKRQGHCHHRYHVPKKWQWGGMEGKDQKWRRQPEDSAEGRPASQCRNKENEAEWSDREEDQRRLGVRDEAQGGDLP